MKYYSSDDNTRRNISRSQTGSSRGRIINDNYR